MASTVIGSSIVIDGEVTGDEDIVVLGTIKGRISISEALQVEGPGVIEATVEAASITVSGSVTGDMHANERIELRGESRVVGDVRAPRIFIADGASFKGSVDMEN
jgi:cytoskeletal protein CcmA (bactofilin family)